MEAVHDVDVDVLKTLEELEVCPGLKSRSHGTSRNVTDGDDGGPVRHLS